MSRGLNPGPHRRNPVSLGIPFARENVRFQETGAISDLDSGLVFQSLFYDGNVTPEKGSAGTFTRASDAHYYLGTTHASIGKVTSGNPAVEAFLYKQAVQQGGFQASGARKNWIQYSEEPATAPWTEVGTPTSVTNDVTTLGVLSLGTILGNSGDGIEQDSGVAATNGQTWTASVWVGAAVSVTGTLFLRDVGGGDTFSQNFTATAVGQRVVVSGTYTAGASGNIEMAIELTASGTLALGGMMLEYNEDTTYGNNAEGASDYVKTEGAVANKAADVLYYDAANLASVMASGTLSLWCAPHWGGVPVGSVAKQVFSMNGGELRITLGKSGSTPQIGFEYGSNSIVNSAAGHYAQNTWIYLVCSWANGATVDQRLYRNGTLIASDTSSTPTTPTADDFYIGAPDGGTSRAYLDGLVSFLQIYNKQKNASWVSTKYSKAVGLFT